MAEDELGRSYPPSNVHELHIESPLPLLECRVRGSADSDTLSFLIGERGELLLRLTNRGALPIADVDVRIQPVFVQNSRQKQITYYSEEELKAEQEQSTAKQHQLPMSSSFSSAFITTPSRLTSAVASAVPPSSTQLPASLSFSSSTAAKRMFDFARSVSQSRRQSHSDSRPTSPAAATTAMRHTATDLPPSPLTWSTKDVVVALPLLPGQHVDIPVQVNAISEWSVGNNPLLFSYFIEGRTDAFVFFSPFVAVSCGLEYSVCYAADKLDCSYRLVQEKFRWDVLPALSCKHVAVLPALQRPATTSSPLSSLPLHLLLDIANRADMDLVLHIDVADVTSHAESSAAGSGGQHSADVTPSNATRIRRHSDRR